MARILLLALFFSLPAPAGASPAEWIGVGNASAELVAESVFGGNVMLYRAGRRDAPAVVLVHGLGQNGARDWGKLIPALAERYEVFALDLPGFGESDKGNHLYSPANYARVIEAVLAPRVARPFVLIGHSMGGAVSLAYAAAYPSRIGRLVFVDLAGVLHRSVYAGYLSRFAAQLATGVYPQDAPWFDSFVRTILTRVESVPLSSELVLGIPALRQRMLRGEPNAIAAYALVEHDFSGALRGVRAPTLVIWGSEDRVAPLRTGQMAAALVPGARLAVIEGADHTPMLSAAARFNALVLDELEERLALPPYALPKAASVRGDRVGRCTGQAGQRFSGDYGELRLEKCIDARITNARIGNLLALQSTVRIVNSEIDGWTDAKNSRLEFTAGSVRGASGSPALALTATSVDAAGTRFEADGAIFENRGAVPVRLSLSVAEVVRTGAVPRFAHEVLTLAPYQSRGAEK
jgi:pimeloyl-ACP methyl ester carboxylesterase